MFSTRGYHLYYGVWGIPSVHWRVFGTVGRYQEGGRPSLTDVIPAQVLTLSLHKYWWYPSKVAKSPPPQSILQMFPRMVKVLVFWLPSRSTASSICCLKASCLSNDVGLVNVVARGFCPRLWCFSALLGSILECSLSLTAAFIAFSASLPIIDEWFCFRTHQSFLLLFLSLCSVLFLFSGNFLSVWVNKCLFMFG